MNEVQIIESEGRPQYAVVPYEKYVQLLEDSEMLQNIRDYDEARAALAVGEDELVPIEVLDEMLAGANPIKTWREYRGLTQKDVAQIAEISVPYLSQLEGGKRRGGIAKLEAIARALGVDLEDLI